MENMISGSVEEVAKQIRESIEKTFLEIQSVINTDTTKMTFNPSGLDQIEKETILELKSIQSGSLFDG